jgi:hypothetical protein
MSPAAAADKMRLAIYGMDIESHHHQQPNSRKRECYDKLLKLEKGNDIILADYILAYKRDSPGIADSSIEANLLYLIRFAEKISKPFGDITREHLLGYLDGIKRPESIDPLGKWKGTYNLFQVYITRFFKCQT